MKMKEKTHTYNIWIWTFAIETMDYIKLWDVVDLVVPI